MQKVVVQMLVHFILFHFILFHLISYLILFCFILFYFISFYIISFFRCHYVKENIALLYVKVTYSQKWPCLVSSLFAFFTSFPTMAEKAPLSNYLL